MSVELEHRDGIPWWKAPAPRRWHKCRAQTSGWYDMTPIARCACGATRAGWGGPWVNRNESLKWWQM